MYKYNYSTKTGDTIMKTEQTIIKDLEQLLNSYETLKNMGIAMETDKVFARITNILTRDRSLD